MKISDIRIGDRVRKDMGDLEALAESIKRHGLLHPVVVKSDGTLIAGHRRIAALQLMGQENIPVTVIEVEDLLSAERDENVERKDFTPTEAVAIGQLIEEEEAPIRKKLKQISAIRAGKIQAGADPSQLPKPEARGGLREKIAAAVGLSGATYYRAKEIVKAAEADPVKFGDLPTAMDETGVWPAHEEMKRRKEGKGRHPVFKKMAYPKYNDQIQKSVWALEGIAEVLEKIPIDQLDPEKTEEWAKSLKKSASIISQTARRIHG